MPWPSEIMPRPTLAQRHSDGHNAPELPIVWRRRAAGGVNAGNLYCIHEHWRTHCTCVIVGIHSRPHLGVSGVRVHDEYPTHPIGTPYTAFVVIWTETDVHGLCLGIRG